MLYSKDSDSQNSIKQGSPGENYSSSFLACLNDQTISVFILKHLHLGFGMVRFMLSILVFVTLIFVCL